jgi:hypothetical protein
MLWDYESSNEEYHAHHDFHVMPNGNILSIAWEARSKDEAIALGRNPDNIPADGLWPDKKLKLRQKADLMERLFGNGILGTI